MALLEDDAADVLSVVAKLRQLEARKVAIAAEVALQPEPDSTPLGA